MAAALPTSLSPHICILPSQDLVDLLRASSLPSLHHVLQSFSPLPQVTTRTTSLASVPHASFALRFSDLADIERDSWEDEEQRAARTFDWIGERISHRCASWVADVESLGDVEPMRTPWWDEVKRCAEGDHVPSRMEGWNHPVALVLAVSTAASNPLQAMTALHSRSLELPPWIDTSSLLRYSLIIHPQNSPLTNEEAGALFNAIKKQYGLHSYLLPLIIPNPPPPPVPVPALMPRLPPLPSPDSPALPPATPINASNGAPTTPSETPSNALNTLRMGEQDIQQTAKFVREFVVMSLVPWMERCVLDWNENFSSTRRLPSRLFSSTRRLFGSQASSPVAGTPPTASSPVSRTHSPSLSQSSMYPAAAPPSNLRRLAEFATILGDIKLAVSVWEALRKEGKGGSDVLPLLLAPSPALQLHASHALSVMGLSPGQDPPAVAQLRALQYAARWDNGIVQPDFLSEEMCGERWLVWAAGKSDEVTSSILLAHAAMLSAKKNSRRRASLWYLSAANRLEKYGIKPLTMYFLRRAHKLYCQRPEKELSPLFWDSQGIDPATTPGFNDVLVSIEHPLGRLSYTTGNIASAVQFFLGLLRLRSASFESAELSPDADSPESAADTVFLEDFRVALQHYQSTASDKEKLLDLKLPFALCDVRKTTVRLPHTYADNATVWGEREEQWRAYRKSLGRNEKLIKGGHAAVGENFWVDVHVRNPLNADISLTDVTVVVEGVEGSEDLVEAEVIDEIVLGPQEARIIPIYVVPKKTSTLELKRISYKFIDLLQSTELLSCQGKRLNTTSAQWKQPTYGPDKTLKVEAKDVGLRLQANFVEDRHLILAEGETKEMRLWFSNTGSKPIREVWIVSGTDDNLWIDDDHNSTTLEAVASRTETFTSSNSITPSAPHRVSLDSALEPDGSKEVSILLHAHTPMEELCLLLVYRGDNDTDFLFTTVTRQVEVTSVLNVSVSAQPSRNPNSMFLLNLILENSYNSPVEISQITTISPTWECTFLKSESTDIPPAQSLQAFATATRWADAPDAEPTTAFVNEQVRAVLTGRPVEKREPPSLGLLCCHNSDRPQSVIMKSHSHLIHGGRRRNITQSLSSSHPHIPPSSHSDIFPLYDPRSVDVAVFWKIPSENRKGHILLSNLNLAAGHAALSTVIEEAENSKSARSMYAETAREKLEIISSLRESSWNAEMNPLSIILHSEHRVEHDFSTGKPCHVPVTFTIRNYSLTQQSQYTLQLNAGEPSPSVLHASYFGRLSFRGTVAALESTTLKSSLWVTRPGTYALGRWQLITDTTIGTSKTKRSYLQAPSQDELSFVIVEPAA